MITEQAMKPLIDASIRGFSVPHNAPWSWLCIAWHDGTKTGVATCMYDRDREKDEARARWTLEVQLFERLKVRSGQKLERTEVEYLWVRPDAARRQEAIDKG